MKRGNKKAQITIFIILGLAIALVLILIFVRGGLDSVIPSSKTPINELKECVNERLEEGLSQITSQGGTIDPENYYLYSGNRVDYLCYTGNYYETCVMQVPLFKRHIENELSEYIRPTINECVNLAETSWEMQGYDVSYNSPEVDVELIPGNIIVNINLDLEVSKGNTESYKSIKIDKSSRLYELSMIATSISDLEARYGDSEIMSYMMYYPDLKVEKKKQGDGSTIYILNNKETSEELIFAVRSLAFPPGVRG